MSYIQSQQPTEYDRSHRSIENATNWLSRTHRIRLYLFISLAVVVRIVLYHAFPIFLTNDSGDYLQAAGDIFHNLDFYTHGLRDVRLPGYPVFLALTYPITRMQSNNIVLLQISIGLACVIMGMAIGYLLHSKFLAEGLVLFLGINPVYLLSEHMLMTETIFLFTLLGFTTIALIALRWKPNWILGATLGFTLGACVLTRVNGILFCVTMIGGVCFFWLMKKNNNSRLVPIKRILGFLIATLVAGAALLGPWIYRNYTLYGTVYPENHSFRNLLVYKSFHGHVDTSLPLIKEATNSLSWEDIDYTWLSRLSGTYSTTEAEQIAKDILMEQIVTYPYQHVLDIFDSFLCFGGYCMKQGGDRAAVGYWFLNVVSNPDFLHDINTPPWVKSCNPDFTYIANKRDTLLLDLWSTSGLLYLYVLRPLLYILLFVLGALYFRYCLVTRQGSTEFRRTAIILLSAGYIATVMLHTITLAAKDRFAAPFDVIALSVIILIAEQFLDLYLDKSQRVGKVPNATT